MNVETPHSDPQTRNPQTIAPSVIPYPHANWETALLKAPIFAWRLGLGPLLGQFLVLITTQGRKTGVLRRTMTEYHRLPNGQKFVPCAFGENAQWYKNIVANPYITIQTADGAECVKARRIIDDVELSSAYNAIRHKNELMLRSYLNGLGIDTNLSDLLAKKDRVYFITFDPVETFTLAPLEADLAWMSFLAALVFGWLLVSRAANHLD